MLSGKSSIRFNFDIHVSKILKSIALLTIEQVAHKYA